VVNEYEGHCDEDDGADGSVHWKGSRARRGVETASEVKLKVLYDT
jgi:hypothetical protein